MGPISVRVARLRARPCLADLYHISEVHDPLPHVHCASGGSRREKSLGWATGTRNALFSAPIDDESRANGVYFPTSEH